MACCSQSLTHIYQTYCLRLPPYILQPDYTLYCSESKSDVNPAAQEFDQLKVFDEKAYELPFEKISPQSLKRWRPAGYHAQRNAAGAMSFMLHHTAPAMGLNLRALEDCWAGVFFLKGTPLFKTDGSSSCKLIKMIIACG